MTFANGTIKNNKVIVNFKIIQHIIPFFNIPSAASTPCYFCFLLYCYCDTTVLLYTVDIFMMRRFNEQQGVYKNINSNATPNTKGQFNVFFFLF